MLWHRPFNAREWGYVLVGLLRIADAMAVVAGALFAYWQREDLLSLPGFYLVAIILAVIAVLNAAQSTGLYNFECIQRFATQFGRISLVWIGVGVFLLTVAYFTKTSESFSRVWAATWFMTSYIGLVINRIFVVRAVERRRLTGQLRRRLAILGDGVKAARVRDLSAGTDRTDVKLVGVYALGDRLPDPARIGLTFAGTLGGLLEEIRAGTVDEVVIAIDDNNENVLRMLLKQLNTLSVDVHLAPDTVTLPFPALGISYLKGAALFDIYRQPLSGWDRIFKRLEDLSLGFIFLLLAGPVMLAVAALIKLSSPGPVLFRQKRLGFNNNVITVYKFRSMRHRPPDASEDAAGGRIVQARKEDDRITPVGHVIRKTSIDELPQLINVLKGDMSLVGPRPHALSHNDEFSEIVDGYLARHRVKPGITGWAQVNGLRGETDTVEKMRSRVEHDLFYIQNWSILFDVKILLLTVVYGFINKNAY